MPGVARLPVGPLAPGRPRIAGRIAGELVAEVAAALAQLRRRVAAVIDLDHAGAAVDPLAPLLVTGAVCHEHARAELYDLTVHRLGLLPR